MKGSSSWKVLKIVSGALFVVWVIFGFSQSLFTVGQISRYYYLRPKDNGTASAALNSTLLMLQPTPQQSQQLQQSQPQSQSQQSQPQPQTKHH